MGNDIVTVRIMGSDYRAAQVGGEKIETDRFKYTRYNHFVYTLMTWRKIWLKPNSPEYEIADSVKSWNLNQKGRILILKLKKSI